MAAYPDRPQIPRGCITLLPHFAERKRTIESLCLNTMKKWGYREITTPIFEYLDVISKGVGIDVIESGNKLTDRQSGRVMILRPDVTPQIARIAGAALRDVRPLRLSYCLDIFRYEEAHGGRQREIFQLGAELIGIREPEGDAEIISLLTDVLKAAKVKNFVISLGHRAFLRGFIEQKKLLPHMDIMKSIFLLKDASRLSRLQSEGILSERERELFENIMFLCGTEEVIGKAESMVQNPLSESALKNLSEVYRFLKANGVNKYIRFDLSDAKGFDYHTGPLFEVILPAGGQVIGYGGRYDSMVQHFGNDSPATGFSLDMERMLAYSEQSNSSNPSVLMVDFSLRKTRTLTLAKTLRKRGFNAIRDIVKRDFAQSLRYAEDRGIEFVIKIEMRGDRKVLSLVNVVKNKASREALNDLKGIVERFN
jgi:ATP phosphoribosyltransferase regulatory subunit